MIMECGYVGDLYLDDLIIAYIGQYYYIPNNIWEGLNDYIIFRRCGIYEISFRS